MLHKIRRNKHRHGLRVPGSPGVSLDPYIPSSSLPSLTGRQLERCRGAAAVVAEVTPVGQPPEHSNGYQEFGG